jgi:uncharacterized membrane protein HdeD (DUF308 family)
MLSLARNWWLVAVRGLLFIILGLLALIWPGATLAVVVLWIGAGFLVTGVFALAAAVTGREVEGRGWLAVEGVAGIVAGLLTFFYPGITQLALLAVVAAWAIVNGIAELAAAVRFRRVIRGEWFLALAGVLSIAFGVLLIVRPVVGLLTLALLIGWFAILYGVALTALGFRLRSAREYLAHTLDSAAARA